MKKRVWIGLAIGLVLLASATAGFGYVFHRETATMSPVPTGQVDADVLALRDGYVNVYLVRGPNGLIAIDAGQDAQAVAAEARTLGVDPTAVVAVFLTHSDGDHAGGLDAFPRAAVFLSEDEVPMIDGTTHRMLGFHNSLERPYSTLTSGQELPIAGLVVRGIATPGHTPGSMSYLVNGRFLFVGDGLSLNNNGVAPFNELFNMDTATQKRSIRTLAALSGVQLLATAHYGVSRDVAAAFASWR